MGSLKQLKVVLSAREAAAVRGKVLAMETDALAFLDSDAAGGWVNKRKGNGHSLVQDYLLGLFTVGGSATWVPARCDPANLVFKTPDLDLKRCKGFIEAVSETECRIRYETGLRSCTCKGLVSTVTYWWWCGAFIDEARYSDSV
jgi:hypothetical protein